MRLFQEIEPIREYLAEIRARDSVVGLVPTMGALHEGHLSLVESAKQQCDLVVVSIFINPLQFNNRNDLKKYPRTLESDVSSLEQKCDAVFAPAQEEFYQKEVRTAIDFGHISSVLEGEFRPGHFSGVGIVVGRLFNIIQPDRAFFGLKDLQQFYLIKQLVADLAFPVDVVGCPTIRDEDGLALSSRNQLLTAQARVTASAIFKGLKKTRELFWQKNHSLSEIKSEVLAFYQSIPNLEIEYFDFVDDDFRILTTQSRNAALYICVAGYIEGIRLIDNLSLQPDSKDT